MSFWPKLAVYLLLTLLTASCAHRPAINSTTPTIDATGVKNILVINTNHSLERYRVSQAAFIETLKLTAADNTRAVSTIDLDMDNTPVETLQDVLNQRHYDAVYCIGAKALGSVDYIDPNTQVVFSSVLNWRRFVDQPRYSGIASDPATEAQLTWFKYFFPDIKTIGVLYSAKNRQLLKHATKIASQLSINIVGEEVHSNSSLMAQANALLPNVDALWLISDSTVLSSTDTAKQLFAAADQHKTPILSYNPVFVEMGALLSISADVATTGRQAALIMNNLLSGSNQASSIQFPAGSSISLNLRKVHEYNIKLNSSALDSVNELVGE
ncbi:ABC transporter substrate-binding protein [Alkalimarinus alittae]|uniref:ABC transporter substrate-binding protein n=1 Tax=Alkalimarinus alittae TaxID=2961619 RepID=A0ABY6N1Q4_9ALTE|nr:ABC transporter substrate binding protein [Alkalimarinus alittae]UZE96036.1 hypothetical protein NKI27_18625 [Alkalimarinus alittae]